MFATKSAYKIRYQKVLIRPNTLASCTLPARHSYISWYTTASGVLTFLETKYSVTVQRQIQQKHIS